VGLARLKKLHWGYRDEPDESRYGQQMPWMAGRVLGGGSSVNGMIWVRGNREDYDHWAELGCEGWSFNEVLPYFRMSETFEGGADEFRGGKGPLKVRAFPIASPLTTAFLESAQAAGYSKLADYNGEVQEGVGICQTNQIRGFRHNTARAYLGLRHPKNLTVETNALVAKVIFEGQRAVGVEYEKGGGLRRAHATREVVLSAGSMASPKILMLSGIGDPSHLAAKGISPIISSPNVGRNLQEHPMMIMVWNSKVPSLNSELNVGGITRAALKFVLRGSGPASSPSNHALLFSTLRSDSPHPDLEIGFAPFGLVGANAGDTTQDELAGPGDHDVTKMEVLSRASVSMVLQMLHPRSRGAIELRSDDPHDAPVIRHRLMDDEDVADLVSSCVIARNIAQADPLRGMLSGEALPGSKFESRDELTDYVRHAAWGAQHPVGTCRMGSDAESVVDPQLRVRGAEGLRVVDASVMPTVVSGNTNAPTIMIAEKAAAMMTKDSTTASLPSSRARTGL
jgi:choline dehydrogenase